jgi:hypothetical protein
MVSADETPSRTLGACPGRRGAPNLLDSFVVIIVVMLAASQT